MLTHLKDSLHGSVNNKVWCIGWTLREPFTNMNQSILVQTSIRYFQGILTLEEPGPGGVQPVFVEHLDNIIYIK